MINASNILFLFALFVFIAAPLTNGVVVEVEQDVSGDIVDGFDLESDELEYLLEGEEYDEEEMELDYDEEYSAFKYDSRMWIYNQFDKELSLYYWANASHAGYMQKLSPFKKSGIHASPGQTLYATIGDSDADIIGQVDITEESNEFLLEPSDLGESMLEIQRKSHPHPSVRYIDEGLSTAVGARFRCLSTRPLTIWGGNSDRSDEERYTEWAGTLHPEEETTLNTYEKMEYFYTPEDDNTTILGDFVIQKNQVLYLMYDEEEYLPEEEILILAEEEIEFIHQHYEETGRYWLNYYDENGPRSPPELSMWSAEYIGQVHKVTSSHGKWQCNGTVTSCQSKDPVELEIEVISLEPRAFIIKNFMSIYEADTIINLAKPTMTNSEIGQDDGGGSSVDDSRTSTTTWLPRNITLEIETITLRAADLLQIDEKKLTTYSNAEDMQVVHYEVDQLYSAHHDWAVNGVPYSRYITLLFYLTDMVNENAGGETSFPKAAGGRGVKVHPGKGSAVLFYNLLPDGNGDDLSLHESIPVREGEKWLANYWVWDPEF